MQIWLKCRPSFNHRQTKLQGKVEIRVDYSIHVPKQNTQSNLSRHNCNYHAKGVYVNHEVVAFCDGRLLRDYSGMQHNIFYQLTLPVCSLTSDLLRTFGGRKRRLQYSSWFLSNGNGLS